MRAAVLSGAVPVFLLLAAGIALAAAPLALSHTPASGSHTAGTPAPALVLNVPTPSLTTVNTTAPSPSNGTAQDPQALPAGASTMCIGPGSPRVVAVCPPGDLAEAYEFVFSNNTAGAVEIQVQVVDSNTSVSGSGAVFVAAPFGGNAGTLWLVWSLGTGSTAFSSITAQYSTCTGTTGNCA